METYNDLLKIKDALQYTDYKNKKSITWLRNTIKKTIRLLQVVNVIHSDIYVDDVVENLESTVKQLIHYSDLNQCFEMGCKEALKDIQGFLFRNRHLSSVK
ncbi:hypothetical protein HH214_18570 [Mucilaginibacter robiniae]|uniref:Uncharacterized protein n=1 Tax=Mucilaginibacter robiniae TaxID=2728022 RepID=A0A7L5EBF9_9SPHI|nr:hypothetical protein [Mucilaginibacter robiniae]QJD97736.1 hypothetical protein HH214_18570 [Mucilaginibacter robiniae]